MISDSFGIGIAKRFGIAYLHIHDLTDAPRVDNILHLLEIRQITAVIGYETGNARLLGDTIDAGTILIAGRKGFLNINRFAGLHGHDGISGMTGRRCGHINSVHIGIVDEFLRIGIPFLDTMLHCVGARV